MKMDLEQNRQKGQRGEDDHETALEQFADELEKEQTMRRTGFGEKLEHRHPLRTMPLEGHNYKRQRADRKVNGESGRSVAE